MIWRRWRRFPLFAGDGPYPERAEAFVQACAMHAASHERTLLDIAQSFAKRAEKRQGGASS